MAIGKPRQHNHQSVIDLCDGVRTSKDIAARLGLRPKYIQKLMKQYNLPRRPRGGPTGTLNGSYQSGSTIDRDGYRLVLAPPDHPYQRSTGYILEHRLVLEAVLGRYLTPVEVVDHIDGNTLNNAPGNLRLFESNGAHLKATLAGKTPKISPEGLKNIGQRQLPESARVNNHDLARKRGEIRAQRMTRAHELLGSEGPSPSEMTRLLKYNKKAPS